MLLSAWLPPGCKARGRPFGLPQGPPRPAEAGCPARGQLALFFTRHGLTPVEMFSASLHILDVGEGDALDLRKLSVPTSSAPITAAGKHSVKAKGRSHGGGYLKG